MLPTERILIKTCDLSKCLLQCMNWILSNFIFKIDNYLRFFIFLPNFAFFTAKTTKMSNIWINRWLCIDDFGWKSSKNASYRAYSDTNVRFIKMFVTEHDLIFVQNYLQFRSKIEFYQFCLIFSFFVSKSSKRSIIWINRWLCIDDFG